MEIADITKSDLNDLGLLYEELIDKKSDINKMRTIYQEMVANGHYYLIGAKVDGKLVGSLMGIKCYDMVGECLPFMVIENVIVSKSQRGMGIGRQLFRRIEEIAVSNHCDYMFFVSSESRTDAHQFYESIGFAKDKVRGLKKFIDH